jgi:Domain of unknown function (DUF3859)
MHKRVLVAFAALLAVDCVLAAKTPSGSITRFGVYQMVGPTAGPWRVGSVSSTTEIHAKQGVRFGVDFQLNGISESSAFVVATLSHPPFVKPDGSSETQSVARMGPFPVNDGRIESVYGFTFDHAYEMVPGNWRIQVSYQGHVLAEKSFHVIAEP